MKTPSIERATISLPLALRKATVRAYRSMAPIYVYAITSPALGSSAYYAATFQNETQYATAALCMYLPDAIRRRVGDRYPLTFRLVAQISAHDVSYEARKET